MNHRIIEGSEKMNIDEVIRLLKMTYWADKRSKEQIKTSMRNSSCYGVYLDNEDKLIGFARVMQMVATAKKPRKQAISGRFWAGRTYRGRIKDDHKID